jgi:hypothetical protein
MNRIVQAFGYDGVGYSNIVGEWIGGRDIFVDRPGERDVIDHHVVSRAGRRRADRDPVALPWGSSFRGVSGPYSDVLDQNIVALN